MGKNQMLANRCSEANQRIATKYLRINQQTKGEVWAPRYLSNIHPRRRQRNMKLCWSLATILLTLEIIVEDPCSPTLGTNMPVQNSSHLRGSKR